MEKWVVAAKRADFNSIGQEFEIDPVIARLIRNRDVTGQDNIRMYLKGSIKDIPSPWLMKDMKKAVKMLKRDKREGFVPFMIMLYLLISSFAETSFFNPTSMLLFLIFAYIEVNAAKRERFRPI